MDPARPRRSATRIKKQCGGCAIFSREQTRNQLELAIAQAKNQQEDVMKESELHEGRARIKVVGCGGGGGNAVNRMISKALKVQFIAVNTDKQALERCQADVKVQMGNKVTRGLGAGGDWTRGRDAADESRTELSAVVQESDMVFITAGMGGGTGTGSAAIVAELAKEAGALTIGVVTRPFAFEGRIRNDTAEEGIKALRGQVDALIVVPNDRLAQVASSKTTLEEAFRMADDVLRQGVQGISDLVTQPGVINLDFADVKAIMENAGEALMGIGHRPQHHLRARPRRHDAGRDQDHGHRHRLRRQDPARSQAGDDASYDRAARVRHRGARRHQHSGVPPQPYVTRTGSMRCPYCGHHDLKVVDSRDSEVGEAIRRRREGLQWRQRLTTYERIATVPSFVTKKDGRREDFDPQKLFTGLKKATEKRDISPERLRAIVDDIEAELRRSGRVEIPSGEIGEMVMDRLRDLDEVAYIRFASVYREFMDLQQVKREIEQVLSSRRP